MNSFEEVSPSLHNYKLDDLSAIQLMPPYELHELDYMFLKEYSPNQQYEKVIGSSFENTAKSLKKRKINHRKQTPSRNYEITELRNKAHNLAIEISQLKEIYNIVSSPMQNEARNQRLLLEVAKKENTRLKIYLNNQSEVTQTLLRKLRSRSRAYRTTSTFMEGEEWRLCQLVAHRTFRKNAIIRILDREYKMLSTILLQSDLYATNSVVVGDRTLNENSLKFEHQIIRQMFFPCLDYISCSNAVFAWLCETKEKSDTEANGMLKFTNLEHIDEDTKYVQFSFSIASRRGEFPTVARCVIKRIIEHDRVVIIWRSIARDELYKDDPTHLPIQDTAWLVFENIPKLTEKCIFGTQMKFVNKASLRHDGVKFPYHLSHLFS